MAVVRMWFWTRWIAYDPYDPDGSFPLGADDREPISDARLTLLDPSTDSGEGPLPPASEPRELTIVHGEIDASDTTAHLLFPTRDEQPFLPFQRFAESMATSRRKGEMHPHQGEEVVQYVLEGYIDHEDGSGNHTSLTEGSLLVLTARDEVRHALRMERGRTARWLSLVVRLPLTTEVPQTSLQIMTARRPSVGSDGTVRTPLVGSNGPARTSSGLELTDIGFAKEGWAGTDEASPTS